MSGDVTTWKTLDLRTEDGCALSEEDQRTIVEVANKALETGYRDPEEVLEAAKQVGLRAHLAENLRAYAMRAIFRVKHAFDPSQSPEQQLTALPYAAELVDTSKVEHIENKLYVQQIVDTLRPSDRAIFLRRMDGMTCPEIDVAMGLKRGTAALRYSICKNALRRASQREERLRNVSRGC